MPENNTNWKTKILIIGGVAGTLLGLGTAYLLVRSAERSGREGLPEISVRDMLSSGIAVIGVVRGIASLGDGK